MTYDYMITFFNFPFSLHFTETYFPKTFATDPNK